jgi:SAM-dependent methyltransferase
MPTNSTASKSTQVGAYAERLVRLESIWWKRLLDVQRPYRLHLQRLKLGFVLEIGCGIGRNLLHLGGRDVGVGVDHNSEAITLCRERGLTAFLPEEFSTTPYANSRRFDSMLLAHVCEHMRRDEAIALIRTYIPHLKIGARVVLICPQEAGFASDATHVEYMDWAKLEGILRAAGVSPERSYSFPFPRWVGKFFKYNEFVVIGRVTT